MMNITTYNGKMKNILFYSVIFVVFLVFFYEIHPIFPFDSDDWKFLSFHRPAIPFSGTTNPTKILPEMFQPLCSTIAAYLFYPWMDDYIDSMALMYAITKAGAITGYVYVFRFLFSRIREGRSYIFVSLFLLCHFLVLSKGHNECDYLMNDIDATYLFHYTIPNLLCFSIAILLLYKDDLLENLSHFSTNRIMAFVFVMYWAMFSSLYANIMIISVVCSEILISYIRAYKSGRKGITSLVKDNKIKFIIIGIWLIIVLIELNGGRAELLTERHQIGLFTSILQALTNFKNQSWHLPVILAMGICVILSLFYIKDDRRMMNIYAKVFISVLIIFVFVILTESQAHPTLLMKGVICYSFMSFFIFLFTLSVIILSERMIMVKYSLPICFCILASTILMHHKTFRDSAIYDKNSDYEYTIEEKRMMIKDVVSGIIEASKERKDSVTINIPLFLPYHGTNWPFTVSSANQLSESLYRHNVTDKKIDVSLVPVSNYTLGK